jgi:glycosyltransferase involved in cell wall biosynthesis
VPACNGARFIGDTLASLLAQDYVRLQILVSDDASEDETAVVCERLAAQSTRLTVQRQARRLGWVGNSNVLLSAARPEADFLFMLPHDDLVAPQYVTRMVAALQAAPEAVLAFADTLHTFPDRIPPRPPERVVYTRLDSVTGRLERGLRAAEYQLDLAEGYFPHTLTVAFRGVFRAEAVDRIGGMRLNPAGEFGADWAWLLELALCGSFVRVPEPLVEKRRFGGSLARTWRYSLRDRLGECAGCVAAIRRARLPLHEELRLQTHLLLASAKAAVITRGWRR